MNMREAETSKVLGGHPGGPELGSTDAYLAANACDLETRYMWDSRRNKYHAGGFEFQCRCDRVFYKGAVWKGVQQFGLVGEGT